MAASLQISAQGGVISFQAGLATSFATAHEYGPTDLRLPCMRAALWGLNLIVDQRSREFVYDFVFRARTCTPGY